NPRGKLIVNSVTFTSTSKSKSSNIAPTDDIFKLSIGPCAKLAPLIVPIGLGTTLTRNSFWSFTTLPSGNVPSAVITIFPPPGVGLRIYLPSDTLVKSPLEALTRTLLLGTPANETEIGLSTPIYTTFILSAAIVAEFGLGTTT